MLVVVNGTELSLADGMTVRHAITALTGKAPDDAWVARDQWGSRVGMEGALINGDRITVERLSQS